MLITYIIFAKKCATLQFLGNMFTHKKTLRYALKKNDIIWEFFPTWGGSSQIPKLFVNYQVIFGMPNSS